MASLLDLNSGDSDSEGDYDYVPPAGEISDASDDSESCQNDLEEPLEGVRKSKNRRKRQKKIIEATPDKEEKPEITPEEEKKKGDELWKQFQMDVGPVGKRRINAPQIVEAKSSNEANTSKPLNQKNSKVTVTEVFDFAGEEVKITKEVELKSAATNSSVITQSPPSVHEPTSTVSDNSSSNIPKRPVSGLAAALGALAKKPKLSTLQKSAFDWNNFKRSEGIEEELQQHNRGKDGFLEKQAFLQRSDLRQFEIEKNIRNLARRTQS